VSFGIVSLWELNIKKYPPFVYCLIYIYIYWHCSILVTIYIYIYILALFDTRIAYILTLVQSMFGIVLAASALDSFPTSSSTRRLMSVSLSGAIWTVTSRSSPPDVLGSAIIKNIIE